jgi:arginase family enzyme
LFKKIEKVVFFGLQGLKVTPQEIKALNYSEKVDLVYLERDIRRSKVPLTSSSLTQAGIVVSNYINGVNFCSVDLSALHSLEFPGVSLPSPACGFTIKEMEEIMQMNGINKVKVITLSEYNPAIEKFYSGEVICRLI